MRIYSIEEVVKPEVPPSLEIERAFNSLKDYAAQLQELTERMYQAAERLIPHNSLCECCNDFKADCLLVNKETLCADCRTEVA